MTRTSLQGIFASMSSASVLLAATASTHHEFHRATFRS
jgi:hypothetical protein